MSGEPLSEVERRLFGLLSWFAPDTEMLGRGCRPLSLASEAALRLMGIRLFAELDGEEPGDDLKREEAEIGVYLWLHTAEIPEIERALWSGAWRATFEAWMADTDPVSERVLADFREMRARVIACVKASRYSIAPRPRSEHDQTPRDVCGPMSLGWRAALLGRWTGWDREAVLWRLPLAEAWQRLHAAEFGEGNWTVPWRGDAGAEASVGDFEAFGLGIPGDEMAPD